MSVALLSSTDAFELRPAFNPFQIIFERRDAEYTSVSDYSGNALFYFEGVDLGLTAGEMAYIRSADGCYTGWHEVISTSIHGVILDVAYVSDDTGYLCSNELYTGVRLEVEFSDRDEEVVAILRYSFGSDMRAYCNPTAVARSLLSKDNMFKYANESGIAIEDTNLSSAMYMRYRIIYDGSDDVSPVPAWSSHPNVLRFVNAAVQILNNPNYNTRELGYKDGGVFLTEFERLTVFVGYPFSVAFIWRNEEVPAATHNVYRVMTYVNAAGFTRVEETDVGDVYGCVVRVNVDAQAGDRTGSIMISGKNSTVSPELETDTVNEMEILFEHSDCETAHIYLCWLNKSGGFSYWLFYRSQEISHNTENTEEVAYPYGDTLTTETLEDILSIDAYDSVTIGANNIMEDQIEGIKSLLHSTRVQVLMNKDGYDDGDDPIWKTVKVRTGTFKLGNKKDGSYSVELTIDFPKLNIQRI